MNREISITDDIFVNGKSVYHKYDKNDKFVKNVIDTYEKLTELPHIIEANNILIYSLLHDIVDNIKEYFVEEKDMKMLHVKIINKDDYITIHPISFASKCNSIKCLKWFITTGFHIKNPGYLSCCGDISVLKLYEGMYPNDFKKYIDKILYSAIMYHHVHIIKWIYKNNDIDEITKKDLLYFGACHYYYNDIPSYLKEHPNCKFETVLFQSLVSCNAIGTIEMFMDYYKNDTFTLKTIFMQLIINDNGCDVIEKVIKTYNFSKKMITSIMYTVKVSPKCFDVLLPYIDFNMRDAIRDNMLIYCIGNRSDKYIINKLLEMENVNVHEVNSYGSSCFDMAVRNDNKEIFEKLLHHKTVNENIIKHTYDKINHEHMFIPNYKYYLKLLEEYMK